MEKFSKIFGLVMAVLTCIVMVALAILIATGIVLGFFWIGAQF